MMAVAALYFLFFLFGTVLASFLAPIEEGKRCLTGFILFGILSLAIPFMGALLAVIYAMALRSVRHRIHEAEVEAIHLPPPVRDLRLRPSTATPGGIAARLYGSRDPKQRVDALSQVMSSRFIDQYRLLRSALKDEAEEVRLLSYAALDQREQENTELLIDLQRRIDEKPAFALLTRLQGYLAWLRWNIDHSVSQELAEPDVHTDGHEVERNRVRCDEEEPSLLCALRCLERGQAQKARSALDQALHEGVAGSIVSPHLAAVHYIQGDLEGLRKAYQHYPELTLSTRYGPSYRYWIGGRQ